MNNMEDQENIQGRPPPLALPLGLALDMNNPIPPEQILTPPQAPQQAVAAPPSEQNCPRCHSHNTKFCYYNNYSLSQPRYFCKGCRRYWTHGGTLRNVPVGGSSRKAAKMNKSSSSSSPSSSAAAVVSPVSVRISPPSSPSTYLTNDGFFTSLAGVHMTSSSPHPMMNQAQIHHQVVNPGLVQNQPINNQFLQMLVNGRESINMESMFLNHHLQQSNMALPNPYQAAPLHFENPNFWSSNENRNNNNNNGSGSSNINMIPNQWPNLPGYGPHDGSSKKDKKN